MQSTNLFLQALALNPSDDFIMQAVDLTIAVFFGSLYLNRYHPFYVRKRMTYLERLRHFDDDVLGLEQQISEASRFTETLSLDLKIHMFEKDHAPYIDAGQLSDAVNHLKKLLIERERLMRKTSRLFTTS